jgi:endonuclease-3
MTRASISTKRTGKKSPKAAGEATSFPIDDVLARIEEAIRPYPKAALFALAEEGHGSTFEQLVACVLSVRTMDETTLVVARELFAEARTPEALARLSVARLARLVARSTFAPAKATQLHEMARRIVDELGGETPCDFEGLTSFRGVGPKCAGLVLGIACGGTAISVDVHVHRVTNRWGYVATRSPEGTLERLREILPERHWVAINRLLVPFGKHVCTGDRPRCSTCPVAKDCARVGVTTSR